MRRLLVLLPLVLVLAACGGGEEVAPVPETVRGTLPEAEAPGKALFTAQGCGGCHTFTPAGTKSQIGPNLDQLARFAERANQPVEQFTERSIVEPDDYVEQGYQPGVMPDYSKLSDDDLEALVEYLTQPQS